MRYLSLAFLIAACVGPALLADAGGPGDVAGCEHFAFGRASLAEGLGGPALEALKSWDGEMGGTFGPNGVYYHLDVNNNLVFRIENGTARILAGDGTRGGRDGPADRARFDLGVGSYSDADVRVDGKGNVYVSEAAVGRLRKIYQKDDGSWHVATIAGGGGKMPKKGESILATDMKVGCTSRLALTPDGTVYFASYGIYRVKDDMGTCLISSEELQQALGKVALADWHVGGSHITPDGVFYWMPGGGPNLYRFDSRSGKAERFAGIGKITQHLDGSTPLESGFHTVLVVYSPDASVIYTCGGDESIPRRIANGKVTSLHLDGAFRPGQPVKGGKEQRWQRMAAVQCLDPQGRLYACTGDYGWGGWIVRFTFKPEAGQ